MKQMNEDVLRGSGEVLMRVEVDGMGKLRLLTGTYNGSWLVAALVLLQQSHCARNPEGWQGPPSLKVKG